MKRHSIEQIFEFHQTHQIPIQYTVTMLLKTLGVSQGEVASAAGIDASYLRQILRGVRPISPKLKAVMKKSLGVDISHYVVTPPAERTK